MGILNNSLKDSLNAEILTALSFIIALIFFRILTTLITDIFDLYRSKKKKIDFEKLDKINYIIISDENLAQ
jgi:1,4-dihydroxy-2-naphthoate octaprenyltransferase